LAYETIQYAEDGPIGTITLNRPDDGNMFTPVTCHEVRDCIEHVRRETRTRVLVLSTKRADKENAMVSAREERFLPTSGN